MPGWTASSARAGSPRAHAHPTPAVLMLTAFCRDEVAAALRAALAVGALLTKPVTPSTLFDACLARWACASLHPTHGHARRALHGHRRA
jgi:CheY-like chemotaxis protein